MVSLWNFLRKPIWSTFRLNILEISKDFSTHGIINKVVNESYIAFIAKKEKCNSTTDCKPISLTTTLDKFITKTIADKILKATLLDTISKKQMGFVKDRRITDAILIPNGTIDYWRTKKIKGFVIKVDLEKTFDKISWRFIDYVLVKKENLSL